MWATILAILKFGAIGVAGVSGIIGTLTNSKHKETGRPTAWGKRLLALIVISSVFAGTIQTIEIYLKNKSDARDRLQWTQLMGNTQASLDSANKIVNNLGTVKEQTEQALRTADDIRNQAKGIESDLEEQRASIRATAANLRQAANTLSSVLTVEQETRFALGHRLEDLNIRVAFTFVAGTPGLDRPDAVNKIKLTVGLFHGALEKPDYSIYYDILAPTLEAVNVDFEDDGNGKLANVFVRVHGVGTVASKSISPSWLDLYGAQVNVLLYPPPHRALPTECHLDWVNSPRTILLAQPPPSGQLFWTLSEKELGPRPVPMRPGSTPDKKLGRER